MCADRPCTDGDAQPTFHRQVNCATLLPSVIDDLAGVFSCMGHLHSAQHQSGHVTFQRHVAATPLEHLFGPSEPFDFQRGAAPHFSRERHIFSRQCLLSFRCLHKRWRFWFQSEEYEGKRKKSGALETFLSLESRTDLSPPLKRSSHSFLHHWQLYTCISHHLTSGLLEVSVCRYYQ